MFCLETPAPRRGKDDLQEAPSRNATFKQHKQGRFVVGEELGAWPCDAQDIPWTTPEAAAWPLETLATRKGYVQSRARRRDLVPLFIY